MPAAGLLALLDDLTMLLDDVAALSKVAAKKTAGIAGDDLAVNAEGLVGLAPERELPIVGKVALGSLANKVVLVPLALALPMAAITPLLMFGGAFLCYEGFHKLTHRANAEDHAHHAALTDAMRTSADALAKLERDKVRGAIVTDVILSAEIVAVALGSVADAPFPQRAVTLSVVALGMTVGIYGFVAMIVKLDDVGLMLQRRGWARLGGALVAGMPVLMRVLSVVGTAAMFLVGGGILAHGTPGLEAALEHALHAAVPQGWLTTVAHELAVLAIGVGAGAVVAAVVGGVGWAWGKVRAG